MFSSILHCISCLLWIITTIFLCCYVEFLVTMMLCLVLDGAPWVGWHCEDCEVQGASSLWPWLVLHQGWWGILFFSNIIYINLNIQILRINLISNFVPAASIARKIYLRQGIGVGGFQKIYGGRQRNGSRPPHFCKSSGAISRNILQQLQKMGIIDVDPKG